MWARTQLKIDWSDIFAGLFRCAVPGDRSALQREVESYWGDPEKTLACFSVRSGLDLLLQGLDLPPDSEIVFSALNVKGMIKIAKRHGLVTVPVDLDIDHMAPRVDLLEQAITDKTKAIVVAHLFGARLDLDPLMAVAEKHGIMVIEDCAQAFEGRDYRGHEKSDIALFSFGPLKTSTALGGALMRVKDPELLARLRRIQSGYRVQKGRNQLIRVLKFSALKAITSRVVFGLVFGLLRISGKNFEDTVGDAVRGVAKLSSNKKLRFQPSAAMLALLARRLRTYRPETLSQRAQTGAALQSMLKGVVACPGAGNAHHTYWVFPIIVENPLEVIKRLRRAGFDGANLPRSQAVSAPEDRPGLEPETAKQALANLLVLPCYPGMSDAELRREADVVRAALAADGS